MTLTEKYKRICALANCDKMTIVHDDEGLFVIDAYGIDGQGDTIEDAFASMLAHAEEDAISRAERAEDDARRIRAKLSGERA